MKSKKKLVLVTGGCRSGKSGYALTCARRLSEQNRYFLATCQPQDAEMQDRVRRHQEERGRTWQTVECPLSIGEALEQLQGRAEVIVVDCLTLWVNNLLGESHRQADIESALAGLADALEKIDCSVILVTNEVGCGIVPENQLSRLFRDYVGLVNQRLAARVDRVIWMVSGCPVTVKGDQPC